MKKPQILTVVLCCVISFASIPSLSSAGDEKKAEAEMSVDEQNKLALEAYEAILELSAGRKREEILGQLEEAYLNVIAKYPKAGLAQESYWRLTQIYINDYSPSAVEKAEQTRDEFVKKYPDSKVRAAIDHTIVTWYVKNGRWDKVLAFFTPAIRKSIETGKFDNVYEIYMYSEAKFNLGDMIEAEKGYKIINANFPSSAEAARAKKRLEEIAKNKVVK